MVAFGFVEWDDLLQDFDQFGVVANVPEYLWTLLDYFLQRG